LEYLGADGSVLLKWVVRKYNGMCTGITWLRIGTVGGLLWTRPWTFGS
jgi:hypothetical protein